MQRGHTEPLSSGCPFPSCWTCTFPFLAIKRRWPEHRASHPPRKLPTISLSLEFTGRSFLLSRNSLLNKVARTEYVSSEVPWLQPNVWKQTCTTAPCVGTRALMHVSPQASLVYTWVASPCVSASGPLRLSAGAPDASNRVRLVMQRSLETRDSHWLLPLLLLAYCSFI